LNSPAAGHWGEGEGGEKEFSFPDDEKKGGGGGWGAQNLPENLCERRRKGNRYRRRAAGGKGRKKETTCRSHFTDVKERTWRRRGSLLSGGKRIKGGWERKKTVFLVPVSRGESEGRKGKRKKLRQECLRILGKRKDTGP